MSIMKTAKKINKKENFSFSGEFVIKSFPTGQIKYTEKLKTLPNGKIVTQYIPTKESLAKAVPSSIQKFKNIVCCSEGYGVNLLLRHMAGDTALPIEIDEVVFGTGVTTPAVTDTALHTETIDSISPTLMTALNNVLTLDIFVPDALMANATYREIGLKMAGLLFTHSTMSYVKGTSQDTTIEYVITYNI